MTSATLVSLNSEWSQLTAAHSDVLIRWAQTEPVLGEALDLHDLLDLVRAAPDQVLLALLRLGRGGDPLAWRVVLQAMLGKAVSLSGGHEDVLVELVSELWLAIADYPIERRPHAVAANLSWTLRRRLVPAPMVLALFTPPEASAEATLDRARALCLIDEADHRTLSLVYLDGLTSARAGAALGISAELVRYRCRRTLRRLAAQADVLAA